MYTALEAQFHTSMTENFFLESTENVFEKYEIIEEIKEGEFGPISKVQPKDPSSVRIYTLKTMHLNRVSRLDLHREELRDEITAQKVGYSVGASRLRTFLWSEYSFFSICFRCRVWTILISSKFLRFSTTKKMHTCCWNTTRAKICCRDLLTQKEKQPVYLRKLLRR